MMDDLISRQAALEMLTDDELERQADDVLDGSLHRYKRAAQRIIAQLPTIDHAQPWSSLSMVDQVEDALTRATKGKKDIDLIVALRVIKKILEDDVKRSLQSDAVEAVV